MGNRFNPYKPSVLFVGHRKTAQTQIRRCRTQRLIRIFTVCSQNVLLEFELKWKIPPNTPKIWNRPVLPIDIGKFNRLKWVKIEAKVREWVCISHVTNSLGHMDWGHGLVSSNELEELGIKLGTPGYKGRVLSTTPPRLLLLPKKVVDVCAWILKVL